MIRDPLQEIAQSPMSRLQVGAVAVCVLLLAIDGFDVLAISFSAPGIAVEWGVDRAALGIVLSMELIGMAAGSIVLGATADRIGRRPTILLCLVGMSGGMFLASLAGSVATLSACRLLTGLGIGGVLASASAMAAEFANARKRDFSVALMAGGYPAGVILGGSVASVLLLSFDWRSVFVFGGMVTLACVPVAWRFLPESIAYLLHRRPTDALRRINDTLVRMQRQPLAELPPVADAPGTSGLRRLFSPETASVTVLLTVAYFAHIMTFYFLMKWIPKIVSDLGFTDAAAGGVLVWANIGGVSGAVLLSVLTQRLATRPLVIAALCLSAAAIVLFGTGRADLLQLSAIAAAAGFCTNAAIVGLYAVFAQSFPTDVRAGGTGFVIGTGRGGAALGPIVAGLLFAAGFGLPLVATGLAAGSLVAAVALAFLPRRPEVYR